MMAKLCPDCKKTFADYYSIGSVEEEIAQHEAQASEAGAMAAEARAKLEAIEKKASEVEAKREKIEAKIAAAAAAARRSADLVCETEGKLQAIDAQLASLSA